MQRFSKVQNAGSQELADVCFLAPCLCLYLSIYLSLCLRSSLCLPLSISLRLPPDFSLANSVACKMSKTRALRSPSTPLVREAKHGRVQHSAGQQHKRETCQQHLASMNNADGTKETTQTKCWRKFTSVSAWSLSRIPSTVPSTAAFASWTPAFLAVSSS